MSLAIATKGILSGVGFGSGTGEGGLYPSDYIAATTMIAVDLTQEVLIDVEPTALTVALNLSEEVEVTIDLESDIVGVSLNQENLEVSS